MQFCGLAKGRIKEWDKISSLPFASKNLENVLNLPKTVYLFNILYFTRWGVKSFPNFSFKYAS